MMTLALLSAGAAKGVVTVLENGFREATGAAINAHASNRASHTCIGYPS